jgi:hypothetical protein
MGFPSPEDLDAFRGRYRSVALGTPEDLVARRRAGASDAEMVSLVRQPDWGGLSDGQAEQLVTELPR